MSKSEDLGRGVIIEMLPNATFKVTTDSGNEIRAYLSGKMKLHRISVVLGDKVEFVIDRLGPNNRIVKRL